MKFYQFFICWEVALGTVGKPIIDCSAVELDAGDQVTGGPTTTESCTSGCVTQCEDTSYQDLSCLLSDSVAGCRFDVSTSAEETMTDGCTGGATGCLMETQDWKNMNRVTVAFTGSYSTALDSINVANTDACGPVTAGSDNVLSCNADAVCEITNWATEQTGAIKFVASNEQSVDLSSTTEITVLATMKYYGESSTCKAITDPTECTNAGCYYCANLDNPTPSGYVGCGVSPSECRASATTTTTTAATTTTTTMSTTTSADADSLKVLGILAFVGLFVH